MKNFLELNRPVNIKMTNLAYEHCCCDFSHEEIISELRSGNELKKQLCILNLKKITSQQEADALVFNLTNQGGPIREVSSLKINEFMQENSFSKFFQTREIIDTFLKAITDVNPSVCRNIIDIINRVDDSRYFEEILLAKISAILEELKEFTKCKTHLLNKKTFNLYWCLEALIMILGKITKTEELNKIILLSSQFNDYTIREKSAKILSMLTSVPDSLQEVHNLLKTDDNLYVRRFLAEL